MNNSEKPHGKKQHFSHIILSDCVRASAHVCVCVCLCVCVRERPLRIDHIQMCFRCVSIETV